MRRLQEHLQAQGEMLEECSRRARQPCHWRLRSAWIGEFVRLSNALTETALVSGTLEKAATLDPVTALLLTNLRLPKLPALPKEGETPSPKIRKTTSRQISNPISDLAKPSCTAASSEIQRRSAERQSQCAEVRLP